MILGLVLLICSALFSYLLNKILHTYSTGKETQLQDGENLVRWASTTKPTVGGISFFITFILASLVFFLTQDMLSAGVTEFLALVVVVTLGFFIGLQDDAYNTRPLLKFLGQVTCAVILIIYNVHIELFQVPALDYFLTIFWVVGIMNSINLLDNMDGVTATVSLTIVGTTIMRMVLFPSGPEMNPFLFALIAAAGGFVGFLLLNWHPSKIYMGDTGSQFLGAFLAYLGIKFFWNFEVDGHSAYPTTRFIVPIMVFLVPIMDTTFVTIARIMRGQSPFVGGKDHLTHNMNYLGVHERYVPLLLGLVSLISGFLAIFSLYYLQPWAAEHIVIYAAYVVISFGLFWYLFKRGERVGKVKEKYERTLARVSAERQAAARAKKAKEKQHS